MKQLKKQGRYIILKRRICAFKVRADFENKRKTDGIYLKSEFINMDKMILEPAIKKRINKVLFKTN